MGNKDTKTNYWKRTVHYNPITSIQNYYNPSKRLPVSLSPCSSCEGFSPSTCSGCNGSCCS